MDNGPEFAGKALDAWAYRMVVKLHFIRPGKPIENAFVESFNGKFRVECLNENWFIDLSDARRKIEAWRIDYNRHRPHSSLRNRTPEEFALTLANVTRQPLRPMDPDRPRKTLPTSPCGFSTGPWTARTDAPPTGSTGPTASHSTKRTHTETGPVLSSHFR